MILIPRHGSPPSGRRRPRCEPPRSRSASTPRAGRTGCFLGRPAVWQRTWRCPAATTAVSGVTETVATESFGGGGGQGAQDDRLPERSLDARQGRIGDAPLHVGVPGGIPLGVTQVGKEVRAVAHDDAGGRR